MGSDARLSKQIKQTFLYVFGQAFVNSPFAAPTGEGSSAPSGPSCFPPFGAETQLVEDESLSGSDSSPDGS